MYQYKYHILEIIQPGTKRIFSFTTFGNIGYRLYLLHQCVLIYWTQMFENGYILIHTSHVLGKVSYIILYTYIWHIWHPSQEMTCISQYTYVLSLMRLSTQSICSSVTTTLLLRLCGRTWVPSLAPLTCGSTYKIWFVPFMIERIKFACTHVLYR
jgi:hypothetical protein